MNEFQKIFDTYGGDYADTIERFMGKKTMYLRFLDMFFQDESILELKKALDAENKENAFTAAHTLKGVAGNLGLTPLYQAVCAIVEPLRNKEEREDYPALYQRIHEEYQRVHILHEQLKEVADHDGR